GAGWFTHLFLAKWLGVEPPKTFEDATYSDNIAFSAIYKDWRSVSLLVIAAALFVYVVLLQRLSFLQAHRLLFNLYRRMRVLLRRLRRIAIPKRQTIMFAFLAIMIPLCVLRNTLDLPVRYTWYLIAAVLACVVPFAMLLFAQPIARITRLSISFRLPFIVMTVITSIAALSLHQEIRVAESRWNTTISESISIWIVYLLSGWVIVSQSTKKKPSSMSVSWFGIGFGFLSALFSFHSLSTHDPAIAALSFVRDREEWLDGEWIDNARHSKQIIQKTRGAARLWLDDETMLAIDLPDNGGQEIIDHMAHLGNATKFGGVRLRNVKRGHDLSPLRAATSQARHLAVFESEWTGFHMFQVGDKLMYLYLKDVKLFSTESTPSAPAFLWISSTRSTRELASFLKQNYASSRSLGLTLDTPITLEDWFAIVDAAKNTRVDLQTDSLPSELNELLQTSPTWDLQNLNVDLRGEQTDLTVPLRLAMNHGAWFLRNFGIESRSPLQGKLSLVAPALSMISPSYLGSYDVTSEARSFEWIYGEDDSSRITHLWLPAWLKLHDDVSTLVELRELRFDVRGYIQNVTAPEFIDLRTIHGLAKLENLYLPNSVVSGYDAVLSLPSLKRLQIRSPSPGQKTGDFSKAEKLEILRLFGKPDSRTIKQLANAPSLKRLEIIDDGLNFQTPQAISKLDAKLTNIEVTVTQPEDYKADLSKRFIKHLERLREEVLDEIETFKPNSRSE
ncbi:MAG: hypothetical protein AAF664_05770, partial [Planctomycetota bacterium]